MNRLYFAYGSNMSTARLQARIPRAEPAGRASLRGYQLCCNKRGKDGTGKANLAAAPSAVAWGALFLVEDEDWEVLDRYEVGYRRARDQFQSWTGKAVEAEIYLATGPEERDIPPLADYRAYCLDGAIEHALPASSAATIARWRVVRD